MSAKKTAAELRTGMKHATERIKTLRQGAMESRDTHPKHSRPWFEDHAQVRAYDLALNELWWNTGGEFGEDSTDGAE